MPLPNSYPIYIPSKGRASTCFTMKALDKMGVDYRVIVEEAEFTEYADALGRDRLLVLDKKYQRDYDLFGRFPEGSSPGSGPARNFAWDHAISEGAPWHWTVDDNIKAFYRFNKNLKVPVADGAIFRCMEDFAGRYRNVAMAGPNYFMFASRKTMMPPFVANTRIFSCNLIRSDTGFRWRGRYNEDLDLSLRMLKAGFCTILFNAFLQEKTSTQYMRGGNTDAFYAAEGTLPKSKMIVAMHPDVARVSYKWGRWHHHVDFSPFKANGLIYRDDFVPPEGVNEYGMKLVTFANDRASG